MSRAVPDDRRPADRLACWLGRPCPAAARWAVSTSRRPCTGPRPRPTTTRSSAPPPVCPRRPPGRRGCRRPDPDAAPLNQAPYPPPIEGRSSAVRTAGPGLSAQRHGREQRPMNHFDVPGWRAPLRGHPAGAHRRRGGHAGLCLFQRHAGAAFRGVSRRLARRWSGRSADRLRGEGQFEPVGAEDPGRLGRWRRHRQPGRDSAGPGGPPFRRRRSSSPASARRRGSWPSPSTSAWLRSMWSQSPSST